MSACAELAREIASHRSVLMRTALRRVRDFHLAEDAVQDTLLAALAASDRFDGRSKLRTWLTGILLHKITDALRTAGRCRTQPLEYEDGGENEDLVRANEQHASCADPERLLESKRSISTLSRALDRLPALQSGALLKTQLEGLDTATACRELGVSRSNLWVLTHRARESLRASLAMAGCAIPYA